MPLVMLGLPSPKLQYCRIFILCLKPKIVSGENKQGLGAILLQKNPENSVFQPVAFAIRSLLDAQTRYSQTQRKVLAVVFGSKRFKNYEYGLRFTIATDHKPLIKL